MKRKRARKLRVVLAADWSEIIMTAADVAAYLNCDRSTVYRLVQRRDIPAFRFGGDWRFRRADIDAWILKRQISPAETAVKRKSMKAK